MMRVSVTLLFVFFLPLFGMKIDSEYQVMKINRKDQIMSSLNSINSESFPLLAGVKTMVEELPEERLTAVITILRELVLHAQGQEDNLTDTIAHFEASFREKETAYNASVLAETAASDSAREAERDATSAQAVETSAITAREEALLAKNNAETDYSNAVADHTNQDLGSTITALQTALTLIEGLAPPTSPPTAPPTSPPTAPPTDQSTIAPTAPATAPTTPNAFSSKAAMESAGWSFNWNDDYVFLNGVGWAAGYCQNIPSTSYCGFKTGGDGTISYTFLNSGTARLAYGSSWSSLEGSIQIRLNNQEIAHRSSRGSWIVTFGFSVGDVLEIVELDHSVINIHSLTLNEIGMFSSKAAMESEGWSFNWDGSHVFLTPGDDIFCRDVPSTSYCGLKHPGNGMISYTFLNSGTARLSYGLSYDLGSVHVLLNGEEIDKILWRSSSNVTFGFSVGDVLQIEEVGHAVMNIHSLTLDESE